MVDYNINEFYYIYYYIDIVTLHNESAKLSIKTVLSESITIQILIFN